MSSMPQQQSEERIIHSRLGGAEERSEDKNWLNQCWFHSISRKTFSVMMLNQCEKLIGLASHHQRKGTLFFHTTFYQNHSCVFTVIMNQSFLHEDPMISLHPSLSVVS